MNQERQKTDAIADAVEIPEGATHYLSIGGMTTYLKSVNNKWFYWTDSIWAPYDGTFGYHGKFLL